MTLHVCLNGSDFLAFSNMFLKKGYFLFTQPRAII